MLKYIYIYKYLVKIPDNYSVACKFLRIFEYFLYFLNNFIILIIIRDKLPVKIAKLKNDIFDLYFLWISNLFISNNIGIAEVIFIFSPSLFKDLLIILSQNFIISNKNIKPTEWKIILISFKKNKNIYYILLDFLYD